MQDFYQSDIKVVSDHLCQKLKKNFEKLEIQIPRRIHKNYKNDVRERFQLFQQSEI